MTAVDILVIVLCVVVVAAVAAGTLIRKIKGKPSACCEDCTKCSAACASRPVARDAQNKAEEKSFPLASSTATETSAAHNGKCAHGCGGCHACPGCQGHTPEEN